MTKTRDYAFMKTETPPDTFTVDPQEVEKTSQLLLECIDLNRISKSAALSAMATIMLSAFASLSSRDGFDSMILTMTRIFDETWKEKNG